MKTLQIRFHQAVCLKAPGELRGHNYARGVHPVPEKHYRTKYFMKLLKCKLVSDAEGEKIIAPASLAERNARLAERLAVNPAHKEAAKQALKAKQAKDVQANVSDESDELTEDQIEEKKSADAAEARAELEALQSEADEDEAPAEPAKLSKATKAKKGRKQAQAQE